VSQKQKTEGISSEVSYAVIKAADIDLNSLPQKIASAINVQLIDATNKELPFVPFDNYESAKFFDKIFLYGQSGSGKSRSIFEIIQSKVMITGFQDIYIINPRNT